MEHRSRVAALAATICVLGASGAAQAAPCDAADPCEHIGGAISSMQLEPRRYRVTSALELADGTTLTIPAGAALYFDRGTGLGVARNSGGRVVIEGTPQRPVLLSSASANPAAGDWRGLLLLGSADNIVHNAQIEFAETGVRAIGSSIEIAGSRFMQVRRNAISVEGEFNARIRGNTLVNEALRVEAGVKVTTLSDMPTSVEVRDNVIRGFSAGIRMFAADTASIEIAGNTLQSNSVAIAVDSVGFGRVSAAPEIVDNRIEGNDEGIFIYGGAPRIERNTIADNPCLAIYINALEDDLGFAPVLTNNRILRNRGGCVGVRDLTIVHPATLGSVDARENYWGPTDVDEVGQLIRDGVDVPGRAVARLCPLIDDNGARVACIDPLPR
jgi:hypothetical protein